MIIQNFLITGVRCEACEAKIKSVISELENKTEVSFSEDKTQMQLLTPKNISESVLQEKLGEKYKISFIN